MWCSIHCQVADGRIDVGKELEGGDQESGSCTATGQMWSESPLIAQVERQAGWARLRDAALDYGVSHTRGLQLLSRVLSHHGKGNHPCPLCDIAPLEDSIQ